MSAHSDTWSESRKVVDILRILTRSPNDISSSELYNFWQVYRASVEVAEFMFGQDLIQSDSDVSDDENVFPIIAVVSRRYGEDPSEWESFLRLLLRKGVNLHSRVPRSRNLQDLDKGLISTYLCGVSEYRTPLDELFESTKTPFEGEEAANRWLELLSSEGYNVRAYLKQESALHAEQMQLTVPSCRSSGTFLFESIIEKKPSNIDTACVLDVSLQII